MFLRVVPLVAIAAAGLPCASGCLAWDAMMAGGESYNAYTAQYGAPSSDFTIPDGKVNIPTFDWRDYQSK